MSSLRKDDVERFSRQLLVKEFGVEAQRRLLAAKVLIVGAGGLGCPAATYLAGAGVGKIGIVDFDEVSITNLHRQVAYTEAAVGRSKAEILAESLQRLNSRIEVATFKLVLDVTAAFSICHDYDVILDCTDNVVTRYIINDVCVLLKKPLVSGSALRWEGQLTVYNFGPLCPCYRCLHPVAPNFVQNCSDGGVIGPVVGMIGCLQASETIKILTGVGDSLAGRLYIFDSLTFLSKTIRLRRRSANCAVCGPTPRVFAPADYQVFCSGGAVDKSASLSLLLPSERVSVEEFAALREAAPRLIFDTREPHEFEIAALHDAKNLPILQLRALSGDELVAALGLHSRREDVFFICHRGNDSQLAVRTVKEKLPAEMLRSLRIRDVVGGYDSWAQSIDKDFPRY